MPLATTARPPRQDRPFAAALSLVEAMPEAMPCTSCRPSQPQQARSIRRHRPLMAQSAIMFRRPGHPSQPPRKPSSRRHHRNLMARSAIIPAAWKPPSRGAPKQNFPPRQKQSARVSTRRRRHFPHVRRAPDPSCRSHPGSLPRSRLPDTGLTLRPQPTLTPARLTRTASITPPAAPSAPVSGPGRQPR